MLQEIIVNDLRLYGVEGISKKADESLRSIIKEESDIDKDSIVDILSKIESSKPKIKGVGKARIVIRKDIKKDLKK